MNSFEIEINERSILDINSMNQVSISYFDDDVYLGEFKYVHQLQNLYFSLTNNELCLK